MPGALFGVFGGGEEGGNGVGSEVRGGRFCDGVFILPTAAFKLPVPLLTQIKW